jgi:tetratricopeptide (TPR) repeat protein
MMSEAENFKALLDEIDALLDSYIPVVLEPDRILGDMFAERAKQRGIFDRAVQLATEGLEKYPFNIELLRRRSFARIQIVTANGEYPELELGEADLRTILEFDPNNLLAASDLIEMMFTFSGMEDSDVAEVAENFSLRAEKLLIANRALQIKALGYADKHEEADEVYNYWMKLFPDSELLTKAKEDADSMKPS